ncbi:hypothetical protein Vretifemale_3632, partial [Volvox reticuliferus]
LQIELTSKSHLKQHRRLLSLPLPIWLIIRTIVKLSFPTTTEPPSTATPVPAVAAVASSPTPPATVSFRCLSFSSYRLLAFPSLLAGGPSVLPNLIALRRVIRVLYRWLSII